jgi:hypothetical protein
VGEERERVAYALEMLPSEEVLSLLEKRMRRRFELLDVLRELFPEEQCPGERSSTCARCATPFDPHYERKQSVSCQIAHPVGFTTRLLSGEWRCQRCEYTWRKESQGGLCFRGPHTEDAELAAPFALSSLQPGIGDVPLIGTTPLLRSAAIEPMECSTDG